MLQARNKEEIKKKRVCVVGAGISGLSAAYELKKAGADVVVYEKDNLAGGRMSTKKGNNFAFDIGADFLSENYGQLKNYAKELDIPWVPTKENGKHRIIRAGKPYYLDIKDAADVFRMGILSLWSKIKFILWLFWLGIKKRNTDFFNLSTVDPRDDKVSAGEFLRKKVSMEVRDYIADPFTSLMQFHLTDEISLGAMSALIKMMITPGGGFVLRYTRGGIGRIPEALALWVGVNYGTEIREVFRESNGARVVKEDGESELFDAVVIATTGDVADEMIKEQTDAERKLFSKVKYSPTFVVALEVPKDLFPDGTHLTYVPYVENEIIGGYTNESRKGDDFTHKEKMLVNVYLHEKAVPKLTEESDESVAKKIIEEFKKVCPELKNMQDTGIKLYDIKRWSRAMPKFYAGYLSCVREFLENGQGAGGIYLAGDYLNSPWTEGAARCGARVAKKILRDIF